MLEKVLRNEVEICTLYPTDTTCFHDLAIIVTNTNFTSIRNGNFKSLLNKYTIEIYFVNSRIQTVENMLSLQAINKQAKTYQYIIWSADANNSSSIRKLFVPFSCNSFLTAKKTGGG